MVAGDLGDHIISSQAISEVGVFTFTATSPNYLGVAGPLGTSTYIGRFYPHHFDTTVGQGCGSFTYSGQPFTVTATAQNNWLPTPSATQNYTGSFAFDTTLSDAAVSPIVNFNGTNTISAASFLNGTATKADVVYTFPVKQTPQQIITLRANDGDTGSASGLVEDTTEIRSGRMRIENAFGSELVDMPITAQAEYYDFAANDYAINTSDNCSNVDIRLDDLGGAADPVTVFDGTTAGLTCVWDDLGNSVSSIPGSLDYSCADDASKPQFFDPAMNGNLNIFLKAPGADITGDIGITLLSTPLWLQLDLDGDGNPDGDPTATASFGLYRGDDRIIYWREAF